MESLPIKVCLALLHQAYHPASSPNAFTHHGRACARIAAAILGGVDSIHMGPGSKVLYLGAASGTSVSHVSDLVGESGCVYAVEFSHRPGRDLINVAKKRTNIIPIIEDARHPQKYRMLVGMVDCVFADVAQPDQVRVKKCGIREGLGERRKVKRRKARCSAYTLVSISGCTGAHRGSQFAYVPEERGPLCDLGQGQLH